MKFEHTKRKQATIPGHHKPRKHSPSGKMEVGRVFGLASAGAGQSFSNWNATLCCLIGFALDLPSASPAQGGSLTRQLSQTHELNECGVFSATSLYEFVRTLLLGHSVG